MTKTVILPSCDDGNRGDQALVWQTHEIAKAAGLADECMMLTDSFEGSKQSIDEGIGVLRPILRHPSTKFSPSSNLKYGPLLYIIWGLISIVDGLKAALLLTRLTRILISPFLTREEKNTIREIRTADACFVKGGGFIHTTKSLSDPYKAFYFLFHVMLAQSLRTSVFVMPNSFGPLNGQLYQVIVKFALSRCVLVTSRESISQDMLEAVGVKSELFPDLAFGLQSQTIDKTFWTELRQEHSNRPLVGITARPYRFPGSPDPERAFENYIDEMAKFSALLFEKGYFPVFVEHVVSAGEHESDMAAIEEITRQLNSNQYSIFADDSLNARQMKTVYSECDFVVGTRFHSVIFALSEGTPALAIGYGGNKGRGIMRDIGLPNNVISIEKFNSKEAIEKFEKLVSVIGSGDFLDSVNQKIAHQQMELLALVKERIL